MKGSLLRAGALLLALMFAGEAAAFTLHKLRGGEAGPTLLLIGGIQGDEPGGFMAADLLLTHYTVTRGTVWLVPNLNFASIIARRRGVHGDMNRKFAALRGDDPEYALVERIKRLIRAPQVSGVVNLHDGSGFYRSRYIDRLHSPQRWGQSTIIDQALLPGVPFGALQRIAERVRDHVNAHLLDAEHRFAVKNTRTGEGDEEMARSLTYYAINQGKPAFAVEASKSFGTAKRVYYHLLAVEAYLHAFGIEFKRHLTLSPAGIDRALEAQPQIALYDRRLVFDVADARRHLGYIPMRMGSEVVYESSSPLVALVAREEGYQVSYGNNRQTLLLPQFMEYDDSLDSVWVEQGGSERRIPFGTIVPVDDRAALKVPAGYRVNLIGYTHGAQRNEAGIAVAREDFIERFSVDRAAQLFRAEVYRGRRFCGMVLLDFSGRRERSATPWRASGRLHYAGRRDEVPQVAAALAER
jgi:hypothetical protein